VAVPPCKGLRSLATLAGSRLLRWALLRLPLGQPPLGSPHGLVVKVRRQTRRPERRWPISCMGHFHGCKRVHTPCSQVR